MSLDRQNTPFAQNPFNTQNPATPPRGIARALVLLRNLSVPTIALTLMVIAGQLVLPPGLRPADLIGEFHGSIDAADMEAKREATVRFEEDVAAARTAPPANYQMEAQIAAQQQAMIAAALEAQANLANLADTSCFLGGILGSFDISPEWNGAGDKMKEACGAGDEIRDEMADTLARTARDNSALVQRSAPKP